MKNRLLYIQLYILFSLILCNFLAQILYFYHLYYKGLSSLLIHFQGIILMLIVLCCFLIPFIFFIRKNIYGYWALCWFLAIEFLFYLGTTILSLFHGYPLFFQLFNHDLILRFVFAVGYINLFASGYFLLLILLYKKILI